MHRRSFALPLAVAVAAAVLSGCATRDSVAAGGGESIELSTPAESPAPALPASGDATTLAKAQAWLDAANLPPGAVRTETPSGRVMSYAGWPCGPYEELKGYWDIPDTSVIDAANWLIENPTADLVTTSFRPLSEEWGPVDEAMVGYVPAPEAQEGIVYTITKKGDGVAVRAEVAAQTGTATCPPLPDGATYGAPGMG